MLAASSALALNNVAENTDPVNNTRVSDLGVRKVLDKKRLCSHVDKRLMLYGEVRVMSVLRARVAETWVFMSILA
jgi:hypothetical protein